MSRTHLFAVSAVIADLLVMGPSVAAGQIGKATPGGPSIVQVIGCLEQASDKSWFVNKAGAAAPSQSTGTSAASLKEAETKPLGKERFRLIGLSVFSPEAQKGHKVEVKGILIKDAKENRVNVTSIQTASDTCTK